MPLERPYSDDAVVSFVRIGHETNIPVLKVPAGPVGTVRKAIHSFVAERLGSDEFTVQLWEGAGFIDVGTHSEGAFTIVSATAGGDDGDAEETT